MHVDEFLEAAVYLLVVTAVCMAIFKRLGLGTILGLLAAGIIIGPYTPGPVATAEVETVRHFTELGVVLLLFLIGLEIAPRRLWDLRTHMFGVGGLQVILTAVAVGAYAHFYIVSSFEAAVVAGFAFALSSTAFVLQLLEERGDVATDHGQISFSILLFQDLAVVPILAVIPILGHGGEMEGAMPLWQQIGLTIFAVGGVVVAGLWIVPWILDAVARQRSSETFLVVTMALVLGAAWLMQQAGLSMALGAFLAGMLLSRSQYHHHLAGQIAPFKGLVLSLFFVSVGMSLDVSALAADIGTFSQHIFIIMLSKIFVVLALLAIFRFDHAAVIRVAFIMSQCGEFGFVIFGVAHEVNVVNDYTFNTAIVVIAASMLATPLVVRLGDTLARRVTAIDTARPVGEEIQVDLENHVIIAGYGRIGHVVATVLHQMNVPYLVFDTDHEAIRRGKALGHNIVFGDLTDLHFLGMIGIGRAALMVMTINPDKRALVGIKHVCQAYPDTPVIARVRDLEMAGEVEALGVRQSVPEALQVSLSMSRTVLDFLTVPEDKVSRIFNTMEREKYEGLEADEDGKAPSS